MVQKSGEQQLILGKYPDVCKVSYMLGTNISPPKVCFKMTFRFSKGGIPSQSLTVRP